jgi:hypothetical protein
MITGGHPRLKKIIFIVMDLPIRAAEDLRQLARRALAAFDPAIILVNSPL